MDCNQLQLFCVCSHLWAEESGSFYTPGLKLCWAFCTVKNGQHGFTRVEQSEWWEMLLWQENLSLRLPSAEERVGHGPTTIRGTMKGGHPYHHFLRESCNCVL